MKNPQLTTYSMVKTFPLELEAMPTFATSSQYYIRGSRWHNGKTNLTSSFQNVLNLLSVFLICCQNGPDFRGNSVQFSHSVVSDSLRPHGLQHTRLPCPSPTPGAYSNSCPLSLWCHPTIASSVIPFLLLPSIFPNIRVFSSETCKHSPNTFEDLSLKKTSYPDHHDWSSNSEKWGRQLSCLLRSSN